MIINEIRKKIQNGNIKKEDSIVKGLWGVDCLFQPQPTERVFDCKFLIAQTIGQGCVYCDINAYEHSYLRSFVGKNYFDIDFKDDSSLELAIMDSLYGEYFNQNCDYESILSGRSSEKAIERSNIIVEEALKLTNGRKDIRVVNVGVVGNILRGFMEREIEVCGTDFDPEIVNKNMFGKVPICHGDETLSCVKKADIAIVTGMTIATQTLDSILETAKENGTKVVVFAETGANFASTYLENGVDVFISEPFPFYIFNGDSKIKVYRKK